MSPKIYSLITCVSLGHRLCRLSKYVPSHYKLEVSHGVLKLHAKVCRPVGVGQRLVPSGFRHFPEKCHVYNVQNI